MLFIAINHQQLFFRGGNVSSNTVPRVSIVHALEAAVKRGARREKCASSYLSQDKWYDIRIGHRRTARVACARRGEISIQLNTISSGDMRAPGWQHRRHLPVHANRQGIDELGQRAAEVHSSDDGGQRHKASAYLNPPERRGTIIDEAAAALYRQSHCYGSGIVALSIIWR